MVRAREAVACGVVCGVAVVVGVLWPAAVVWMPQARERRERGS